MTARTPLLLFAFVLLSSAASGQTGGGTPVTLRQTVEPSFRIEPVVHRFKAQRGKVLPFAFAIGSLGRDMSVTVTPVSLRQEETGIILHNTKSAPGDALQLTTPQRFRLGPGEQKTIGGKLTVPIARSNYLSYGILVREEGRGPRFDPNDRAGTKAGVRFVTQYVLRVDVETGGAHAGASAMDQLRIERGALAADRGLPKLRAFLRNPTDFAFECFVNARFEGAAGPDAGRQRPIKLGMISRATLEEPERHLIRIMPKSTLRLEAPVTGSLTPGDQTLRLSLSSGRRELLSADFAISVNSADFPALARESIVLGGGVSVSPAQIELGSTRDTERTLGMKLLNTTGEPMTIGIEPRTLAGASMTGVRFSPKSFTIKPGRSKNVRVMLRGSSNGASEAGVARVTLLSDSGATDRRELPLAVLRAPPTEPRLSLAPIAWKATDRGGAFALTVTNNGAEYCPIAATLAAAGPNGLRLHLEDGYGVWLAPGATRELLFRPADALPTGEYTLALQVETREQFAPIVRTLNVVLAGNQTASTATPKTTGKQG